MLKNLILLLPMILVSQFVFADTGTRVPTASAATNTYKKGLLCYNAGSSAFKCAVLGDVTVAEIYANGYRVVATLPSSGGGTIVVIEQQ
jgi:hypothetical protein